MPQSNVKLLADLRGTFNATRATVCLSFCRILYFLPLTVQSMSMSGIHFQNIVCILSSQIVIFTNSNIIILTLQSCGIDFTSSPFCVCIRLFLQADKFFSPGYSFQCVAFVSPCSVSNVSSHSTCNIHKGEMFTLAPLFSTILFFISVCLPLHLYCHHTHLRLYLPPSSTLFSLPCRNTK